jgi:hypothetical protein
VVLAVRGGQPTPAPPVSGIDHDGTHTYRG